MTQDDDSRKHLGGVEASVTPPIVEGSNESLALFVRESNHIEGIKRKPLPREIKAHEALLALPSLGVCDMVEFVAVVAPGKRLRALPHMNVQVGNHIAPQGGAQIAAELEAILSAAWRGDPFEIHRRYETLHPFMDGNGRSGRALWLWMMCRNGQASRAFGLGFLHTWYYQSLDARR